MTVPGFGSRAEADRPRARPALGRPLQDLDWYEVFALARASAISTRIAVLHERAGQRSMFKVGEDPTLAAAVARIEASVSHVAGGGSKAMTFSKKPSTSLVFISAIGFMSGR